MLTTECGTYMVYFIFLGAGGREMQLGKLLVIVLIGMYTF